MTQTSFETLSVIDILNELRELGCTWWLDEKQQFRVKPKSRIPEDLQQLVLLHRGALAAMILPDIQMMTEEIPHPADVEAFPETGKLYCLSCKYKESREPIFAPVVSACPACGNTDVRHPNSRPQFCCKCWSTDAWIEYLLPILEGRDTPNDPTKGLI